MSTKTTLKRIALVAVSALGFGVLTAVAPASAASDSATAVAFGTAAPARPGVTTAIPFTVTGTYAGSDTQRVAARLVNPPATSSLATLDFESIQSTGPRAFAGDTTVSGAMASNNGSTNTAGNDQIATATYNDGTSTTSIRGNILFTPDVAGTYQILLYANDHAYAAGTTPAAVLSITTAGTVTSATLTTYSANFAAGASTDGTLIKIDLKDANGNATVAGAFDSIDLRAQGSETATTITIGGTSLTSFASAKSYGASAFKYGSVYLNVTNTAAEPFTIALTGSSALAGSGLTATVSLRSRTTSSEPAAGSVLVKPDSAVATAANTGGFTSLTTPTVTNLTTQPLEYAVPALTAATALEYFGYHITDTAGLITGSRGAVYSGLTQGAVGDVLVDFSIAASLGTSATSNYFARVIDGGTIVSASALEVRGGAASAAAIANGTPSVVLASVGGSVSIQSRLTNNFGGGVAGAAVTVTRSGRNATTTSVNLVTDASGYVTHTYTDAGTAASVLTSDTVSFAVSGLTSGTATVNWGTTTVGTVTVTGAASEDVAPTVTPTNISAGASGPNGAPVDITATVKDANGNLLVGVPVTFTLSGVKGSAIQKTASTDFTTVYTNTSGAAVTKVLGWEVGKTTITATAGGKTGEGAINWVSPAGNARVLSGTVNGNIISYKVVDRFGNPVTGATITLSRTGTGLFGDGKSATSLTTDKLGTADVSYTGDATVTAELATSSQAYSAAGKVGTTAVTAAVAGTTTGLGDTLAPAGVGKVDLKVALGVDASTVAANAAADAAAEAIDAANAATDAANLAAEAADAATVAAEEARDAADAATAAVEELATQVATLMAALKAQITTLANTVAKIARKVRA